MTARACIYAHFSTDNSARNPSTPRSAKPRALHARGFDVVGTFSDAAISCGTVNGERYVVAVSE